MCMCVAVRGEGCTIARQYDGAGKNVDWFTMALGYGSVHQDGRPCSAADCQRYARIIVGRTRRRLHQAYSLDDGIEWVVLGGSNRKPFKIFGSSKPNRERGERQQSKFTPRSTTRRPGERKQGAVNCIHLYNMGFGW